jgi:hypothetical protein
MIIKASFRKPGGLASHLVRTDTNERATISNARDLPLHVEDALGLLSIMGAACQGERCLIHVVASPSPLEEPPTPDQLTRFWNVYEDEFGLAGHPFIEIQHQKGYRPAHVHRVYARRNPASGHSAHDAYLKVRNEKLARIFELECGHEITVGRHQKAVRQALESERPEIASAIDVDAKPKSAQPPINHDETQQADVRGIDPRTFRQDVYRIYQKSGGNWRAFAGGLDRAGISVARGDRALMVLDCKTGHAIPMARCLRTEAKASGNPIKIISRELELVFRHAKPLSEERKIAAGRATSAPVPATTFFDAFAELAKADLALVGAEARHREARVKAELARRKAIQSYWKKYHFARGMSHFLGENTVLLLAVGVLASGGIVPAFLLTYGAFVLTSTFASVARESAERLRHQHSETKSFSYAEVHPRDRLIFGAYAHALLSEDKAPNGLQTICEKMISPDAAKRFANFFATCTPRQYAAITSWFRPDNVRHLATLEERAKGGEPVSLLNKNAAQSHGNVRYSKSLSR